jgi:hypothetical protein
MTGGKATNKQIAFSSVIIPSSTDWTNVGDIFVGTTNTSNVANAAAWNGYAWVVAMSIANGGVSYSLSNGTHITTRKHTQAYGLTANFSKRIISVTFN